jgi:hypothetical protein
MHLMDKCFFMDMTCFSRYTANDPCTVGCQLMYKDHYHCSAGDRCRAVFRSKEGIRDHSRQHQLLQIAANSFTMVDDEHQCTIIDQCPLSAIRHYHCNVVS